MEFKKCVRCGCFFASDSDTCCNCTSKDNADIVKLKEYLVDNLGTASAQQISLNTGIASGNLDRYLQAEEFSNFLSPKAKNKYNGNIGEF